MTRGINRIQRRIRIKSDAATRLWGDPDFAEIRGSRALAVVTGNSSLLAGDKTRLQTKLRCVKNVNASGVLRHRGERRLKARSTRVADWSADDEMQIKSLALVWESKAYGLNILELPFKT